MKATISPNGDFELEGDADEVVAAIIAIRDKASPSKPVPLKAESKKRGRPPATEEVSSLNESQSQTWQYLVANDVETGLSPTDYAKHAGIAHSVADNRLRKLAEIGLAVKIAPGRYRINKEHG